MRWPADLFNRARDQEPLPPEAEERLEQAIRGAYPGLEAPDGLGERIERAALAAAAPSRPGRRLVLLPAAAVFAILAVGLAWQVPGLRAHQITASMRAAWETVRDYQATGTCTAPVLGRAGNFGIRVWYRRPGDVRADVAGPSLQAQFLVAGHEARIRIPALATDVLVPLQGDFAFLRDLAQVGETLRRLEQMRELHVVGTEEVAGQPCYVLHYRTRSLLDRWRDRLGIGEQTRKEVGQVAVSGKVWVSKATLLPMKMATYDADHVLLVTAAFEKVTINQGVPPAVFRIAGREKAERLRAYTWQELVREAAGAAEELWRGSW